MSEKPIADGAVFLLSDLIGGKVQAAGRTIGRLGDLVAVESAGFPRSPICSCGAGSVTNPCWCPGPA